MSRLMHNRVLVGDVRERLTEIPDSSVDCVITSPPYYQLRDYGASGQIGLEATVDGWVDELLLVLRGLKRVLKPTGSLWLNLGDSYSRHARFGTPAKGLLLGPERVVLALAADGWIVRNKVVWAKTNPLPHSVADRLTNKYEVVYFLTRSPRYFFDLDAIRLRHDTKHGPHYARTWPPPSVLPPGWSHKGSPNGGLHALKARGMSGHPLGKNPGDVWTLATGSFRGAHFATFPPALVERPLLATCPEHVCSRCGTPVRGSSRALRAECECRATGEPGLVLDPFFGAGTVGLVAEQHGRDWLGIELNPAYAELARTRIEDARAEREIEREAA